LKESHIKEISELEELIKEMEIKHKSMSVLSSALRDELTKFFGENKNLNDVNELDEKDASRLKAELKKVFDMFNTEIKSKSDKKEEDTISKGQNKSPGRKTPAVELAGLDTSDDGSAASPSSKTLTSMRVRQTLDDIAEIDGLSAKKPRVTGKKRAKPKTTKPASSPVKGRRGR